MDTPFTWAPNRCANKSTFNAKHFSKLSKLSHISAYITWSLLSSGRQRLLNAITPPILHKQPRDQAIRVKFNMSYTIADINIKWIALSDPCDICFSNGLPRLCSTKSRTLEYRNKNTCFSGVNRLVSKAKYDTDTLRYWYCWVFLFHWYCSQHFRLRDLMIIKANQSRLWLRHVQTPTRMRFPSDGIG